MTYFIERARYESDSLDQIKDYVLAFFIVVIFAGNSYAFQDLPNRLEEIKQHKNGKLWSSVTNYGSFGFGVRFPGSETASARYINRGGLLFGGIVDADGTGRNPVRKP